MHIFVSASDYEEAARASLPPHLFEWLVGGAADEITLRWNRESFDRIRLSPRVLRNTTQCDCRISLFGEEMPFPILLAPTALQRLFHPDGELAVAQAAGDQKVTFIVSQYTTSPIKSIAGVASGPLWLQLYPNSDRGFLSALVSLADEAGFRGLCLTVDLPTSGPRNRAQRAGFAIPPELQVPYLRSSPFEAAPGTWADVEWLLSISRLPVILKGILNPVDADLAVKCGVSGIVVSNHGGRDLDTTPATIDALPIVAASVAGRVPILLDGGVRRGTDILKALALGAQAVLIGRPYCYALASDGADGVRRLLSILYEEFKQAMMLTGFEAVGSIEASAIWNSR